MRAVIASTIAAFAVVAAAGLGCHAASADDFASHVTVSATATKKGELHLVITPKDGWMVNTAYPAIKVKLQPPAGVKLGKTELGHGDATYQGKTGGDHAAKVVFATTAKGKAGTAIPGTYKMVICSADTCSPPFHGSFSVTLPAPGA